MESLTTTIEQTPGWNRERSSEELRDYVMGKLTSLSLEDDSEFAELELAA